MPHGVKVQVLSAAPNSDFSGKRSALALFFHWLRGARTKGFSGGNEIWSAAKAAHSFVFGRHSRHAPRLCYYGSGHNLIGRAIFVGLYSRPVQFGSSRLCPAGRLFK